MHGAAGVSQDFFLAYAFAQARTLRIADGPDEVSQAKNAAVYSPILIDWGPLQVHTLALAKDELVSQRKRAQAQL